MLFSSFVSIFRALCRPLHGPSCSLQTAVLFYDFDSTSTRFLKIQPVYLTSLLANNMPKITFVALPKYESFRDTTGYVTANASRQRSTSLVFPSSLTLPSFHPILFFTFNSSKALQYTTHTSKFLQHTSFNRPTSSTPP